jgi:hypothetical protein
MRDFGWLIALVIFSAYVFLVDHDKPLNARAQMADGTGQWQLHLSKTGSMSQIPVAWRLNTSTGALYFCVGFSSEDGFKGGICTPIAEL